MNDLTLSLEITALGMGLVFGAIILLWVMMIVLTSATADKNPKPGETSEVSAAEPVSASESGFKLQAAALAVALALSEQEQSTAHPLQNPPTALVSAWQLGMRTSQRSQKGNMGRR